MEINNRTDLDAKLASLGYVHPDTPQMPRATQYKTINVTDEKAQYESSNKTDVPYKNFSQKEDLQNEIHKTDICPKCNEKALYICECNRYGDMMCKNNHIWYITKDGQLSIGDPHENED